MVSADPKPRSIRVLRGHLRSSSRDARLVALSRIRKQIETRGLRDSYFTLAKPLTLDPDSICRWQATIIVGEFIETKPDRVWQVAKALATSPTSDIRAAASTVLLEHLLEYHTATMAALVRAELALGDWRFADSVASCWTFGNGLAARRVQRVINEARILLRSNKALLPTSRDRRTNQSRRRSRTARN